MCEEMADITISGGSINPPKNGTIALIDADTIIFSACTTLEYIEDLLPREMYSEDEWADIVSKDGYCEADNCLYDINLDEAIKHCEDKIQTILDKSGCIDYELHFTNGRNNFRYTVEPSYKSNRSDFRPPQGLYSLKMAMVDNPDINAYIHTEYEADDIVVALKRDNPDKYTLVAVDKDVLYSLEGRHFNYYTSVKYNIDMKYIDVSADKALKHHYIQVLTGDPTDGIIGLHGIGPKKAEKLLKGLTTHSDLWDAVVKAYEDNGRDMIDALINMRLVSMHQLHLVDGKYKVVLWKPL